MNHSLRRALSVVFIALLVATGVPNQAGATTVSEYCQGSVEQEFLTLINTYRVQHGLGQLAASQTLGAAAQHHALDMATTNTLAHTLSDGTTWLDNIINHGYPYGYRTENIAWGYATAQNVFDAWKASSTSGPCRSTRRHTLSTSRPCRQTISSKAASLPGSAESVTWKRVRPLASPSRITASTPSVDAITCSTPSAAVELAITTAGWVVPAAKLAAGAGASALLACICIEGACLADQNKLRQGMARWPIMRMMPLER